jgi:hypothetical protein
MRSGTLRAGVTEGRPPSVPKTLIGSRMYPTPRACSGKRSSGMNRTGFYDVWREEAGLLPTPVASDGDRQSKTYPRGNPTLLGAALSLWPTPCARDYKSAKRTESEQSPFWQLNNHVWEAEGRPPVGTLNPEWVEWVMGFDPGWTER